MEFPQAGSGPNRKQIIDALRNTAQSASNMVAENVSMPMDAIAWALRKAGVPVEKPMFGSDWMKEKGVTPPVREGASKVIGDTIGMISPMGLTKQGAKAMMDVGGKMKNLPVGLSTYDVSGLPNKGRDLIQADAERLSQILKDKGFSANVNHSGSAMGPSSYLDISDPETGRFLTKQVRLSGHSKGPKNLESVIDINGDEFNTVIGLAENLRSSGKSQVVLMNEKAQELINSGVPAKSAYRQAREMMVK